MTNPLKNTEGRPDVSINKPSSISPRDTDTLIVARNLYKTFILHQQGGIQLPILQGVSLQVKAGECVALQGPSGSGKSTLMRSLYGNYRVDRGEIWLRHRPLDPSSKSEPFGQTRQHWQPLQVQPVQQCDSSPQSEPNWVNLPDLQSHELIQLRQQSLGYVSQFLRVIPRVSALDVAAEPLLELGRSPTEAKSIIEALFTRLNLPERLWSLSPTTFSGGEKQRVNIARVFSVQYPVLLLDEPTSALDAINRQVVIELIEERKAAGSALIGIFHDPEVQQSVANRVLTFERHNQL